MSGRSIGAAIIGAVFLAVCLVAVQIVVLPAWGVMFDGCTKYVSLTGIEAIARDVWKVWLASLLANLIVLLTFLSAFLRRPKLLVSGPSIAVLLLLATWKALAIATDVNYASRCGEARDFDYPVVWAWAGNEFVFFLVFTSWCAMTITAVAAAAFQKLREEN